MVKNISLNFDFLGDKSGNKILKFKYFWFQKVLYLLNLGSFFSYLWVLMILLEFEII